MSNNPGYNHIVVNEECEHGGKYHDDMLGEGVKFIVPEVMKRLFRDFRIFNGMSFSEIDEMLKGFVPLFNKLESRCKRE